jgi:hypothetical protein
MSGTVVVSGPGGSTAEALQLAPGGQAMKTAVPLGQYQSPSGHVVDEAEPAGQ